MAHHLKPTTQPQHAGTAVHTGTAPAPAHPSHHAPAGCSHTRLLARGPTPQLLPPLVTCIRASCMPSYIPCQLASVLRWLAHLLCPLISQPPSIPLPASQPVASDMRIENNGIPPLPSQQPRQQAAGGLFGRSW